MHEDNAALIAERAAQYRRDDPGFAKWAEGYGVIRHSEETQVRVGELARRVQGEAQAEAIRSMGAALSQNPLVVEYKKVERWGGAFPSTFMGGDAGANTLWSLAGQTAGSQGAAAAKPPVR